MKGRHGAWLQGPESIAASILTASPKPKPITSAIARSAGASIDMRDLDQVLAHVHDAEIGISEGPEPPRQ